jgi:hypothetical protein
VVKDFVCFTGISLNPSKCKAFKYVKGRNDFVSPAELWNSSDRSYAQVPWVDGREIFKYLGIPLGKNKIGKLRFSEDLFNKVDLILDRLRDSGLKITQLDHAVKTYVLHKFDYLFHNSMVPVLQLRRMDKKIRAFINSAVGGQALSKPLFYADWRSGGFGLKSLVDRSAMCRVNQVVQLYNSSIRKYVEWRIMDEGSRKSFQIIDESEFMG